jgi:hypothetical protein
MAIPKAHSEFHCFDFGTIIQAEVRNGRNQRIDLSGAFAVEILFMRPDGSGFAREAQLGVLDSSGNLDSMGSSGGPLPGEEGVIFYILQPGDIDTEGNWHLQFYVEAFGGAWYSSVVSFTVLPNIVSPHEVLQP